MNAQGQKTGGRQKGTPNKITAEIREFLASLFFDNMDLIRQDVKDMTPEQRAVFLPKILPYIVPKQKPKTEKDEQDIACDHVKSFLNLAQIVNGWEQEQQPSHNPAEAQQHDPSAPSDSSDNPDYPNPSDSSDPSAPSDSSAPSNNSAPFNNSASSDPSDLSTSPVKPVKRPTKQMQQRTPFYRNIKTKRTLKKCR